MNKPTILLTGAAGFIGSHTAQALIARGYHVVGVDNFCDFYPRHWKELNIHAVGQGLDLEELDIADGPRINALINRIKPHGIIHLAAMAGVRPSIEQPVHYARVNLEGTTNLLQAAAQAKVARFVFASSSSVYGNNAKVPFAENRRRRPAHQPLRRHQAAPANCSATPSTTFTTCPSHACGSSPSMARDKGRILPFTNSPVSFISERPSPVFGDGSTSRDYSYVDDIVAGILAAYDRNNTFRIFNLGGSQPVKLSDLIAGIEAAMGKRAIIDRKPAQPGDVERTCADVQRSRDELAYIPQVRLAEGLNRFAQWLKQNIHDYTLPNEPKIEMKIGDIARHPARRLAI